MSWFSAVVDGAANLLRVLWTVARVSKHSIEQTMNIDAMKTHSMVNRLTQPKLQILKNIISFVSVINSSDLL